MNPKVIAAAAKKFGIDENDITAFIRHTNWSSIDFYNSKAVRDEFMRWCNGKFNIGETINPSSDDGSDSYTPGFLDLI